MKQFIYDGSFDGLLTALFYAYPCKQATIVSKYHYTLQLFVEDHFIDVEDDKCERVTHSIVSKLNPSILKKIYLLYLSDVPQSDTLALDYLKLCYKYGVSINLAKNNDLIIQVDTLVRRVTHESHRMTGFIRFKAIGPQFYYATIEPDHHILPLIADHFTRRFSDQHFIIHDLKRQMALIYNQKDTSLQLLTPTEHQHLLALQLEDDYEDLFRTFFKSVTIAERTNPRLQKRMMPTRYWKHLTETK